MQTADAVIIGGGIIGCAIAESLAGLGMKVALVERGLLGREASWAAAGMLAPQSEMPEPGPYLDFCLASRRLYPATVERVRALSGIDPQYRDEGMLYAAFEEADEATLRARAAWQRAMGLGVAELSAAEALDAEPALSPRLRMAARFDEDHQVDPRLMTRAYAVAARGLGAELMEHTPALRVVVERGRVEGVEIPQGRIATRLVVLAAGCWSRLTPGVPEPPPTHPVKGQMLALEVASPIFARSLHSVGVYLVPRRDGRVIVGSTEEPEAGFDRSSRAEAAWILLERAFALCPALRESRLADLWTGLRPGTPDKRAIIGDAALADGLVVATGHHRNGILLAPITAARVAERAKNGAWNGDVIAFSPNRFGHETNIA